MFSVLTSAIRGKPIGAAVRTARRRAGLHRHRRFAEKRLAVRHVVYAVADDPPTRTQSHGMRMTDPAEV
jgi:hypothetical protein